jgi:hypothetical protein
MQTPPRTQRQRPSNIVSNNPLNMQTPRRPQRQGPPGAPARGRPPPIIIPNVEPMQLFPGNGGIRPPGGSPGRNHGGRRKSRKSRKSRK